MGCLLWPPPPNETASRSCAPFWASPKEGSWPTSEPHALPFIQDPSNNNAAFERVRLRHATKALASAGITRTSLAMTAARLGRSREALARVTEDFLDRHFQVTPLAQGKISREAFEALPDDIALRALGRILSLIGGAGEPPRLMRLEHLLENLKLRKRETTIGGCIMTAASGTFNFYRELGRLRVRPATFEPGVKRVWDGRFILEFAPIDDSSMTVRQTWRGRLDILQKNNEGEGLAHYGNPSRRAYDTRALERKPPYMCASLELCESPRNMRRPDRLPKLSSSHALPGFCPAPQTKPRACLAKTPPYPIFE